MLVPGEDEVRVDFVGDHQQIVALHDLSQPLQLLAGPHAPGGVVGIAHHENLAAAVDLGFQQIEVDGVVSVLTQNQGAVDDHPAVFPDAVVERAVDRGHDQHPVAGVGEGQNAHGEGRHHPWAEGDPLLLNIPVIPFAHPGHDGI